MDIKNFKKECESAITNTEWCDFEHDYEVMQFYYEDHLFYKLFLNILLDDHKIKVEYKCSKDIIFYDFNKLPEKYQNEILKDLKYNQDQRNAIQRYNNAGNIIHKNK